MTSSMLKADPIRIVRLVHMRYRHPDLKVAKQFLEDFGLHLAFEEKGVLYFAGQGPDPYVYIAEEGTAAEFLGGAFLVESEADLVKAQRLYGASEIVPAGPAGGLMVSFHDPDHLPCHLVWGLQERSSGDEYPLPLFNFPTEKPRKGTFRRFDQEPCPVWKLGHYGLLVSDYHRTYDFWTKNFNLVASDILTAPDGSPVAGFLHVDRGEDYVDHHTIFFSVDTRRGPHHCSFEVKDADVQAIGHEWLKSKGYTPSWGIGRHILGSQIFDYWYSPEGFMMEHYSDGDLVNNKTETTYLPAADEALAVWGPAVPEGFMSAIPMGGKTYEMQTVA